MQDIERLVGALADIKRLYAKDPADMLIEPSTFSRRLLYRRRTLFMRRRNLVPIRETAGKICGEFVMCYPPGIPILAPGETDHAGDH